MADKKKITMKYWDSLEEGSRFRALRKVFSNFPDSINRDYAKEKANKLDDWIWKIIQHHVKQPIGEKHYKTCIDNAWLM
ncbi:MAG: hypothetical protein KBT06_08500 [Prevotellaceae bacterium]|nr:hypothetical protein [Candidatus Colivivens equi]